MERNDKLKNYVLNQFPTREDIEFLSDPLLEYVLDEKHAALCKITEYLYITSIGGITERNFEEHNFTTLFDMSKRPFYIPCKSIEFYKYDIEDTEDADISHVFDTFADKVHSNSNNQKKTLVHCYAGVSRSATLVLAYLMKYEKLNLRDAFNYLRERRPVVRPNNGFFKQLIAYELKLFGKTSVHMIELCDETKRLRIIVPNIFDGRKDLLDWEFDRAQKKLVESGSCR
ncbi:dual specificity protein phosphatase 14-like isoform X2 [Leptotrombidium deliense]|uniref:Dual specificity protein phosphatase 14-like isoform X2 n=1 Tax=Leptotrombidium deliense TaxID=299467 RepID=A0A443S1N6_9ACAR|nr:dual specificity protein phosphatase 14-like isoform X2 [Leptotrombidium deliense]